MCTVNEKHHRLSLKHEGHNLMIIASIDNGHVIIPTKGYAGCSCSHGFHEIIDGKILLDEDFVSLIWLHQYGESYI